MKSLKFWLPIIISLGVTPVMILLGFISAGAGHGDYFLAKILFPYTMLSTSFFRVITDPFVAIGFLQFPIYGLILAFGNLKEKIFGTGIFLSIVHMLFVLLCFVFVSESFS